MHFDGFQTLPVGRGGVQAVLMRDMLVTFFMSRSVSHDRVRRKGSLQITAHGLKGEPMEATAVDSPYLTYEESARYCNIERTTIWRAVKAGQLQASGPGTAVRFHRNELDRWMDSRNRK